MLSKISDIVGRATSSHAEMDAFFGATLVVGPSGRIEFMNSQARLELRCSVGDSLLACCEPDENRAFLRYADTILANPELRFRIALQLIGPGGQLPFQGTPLLDQEGSPYGFVVRHTASDADVPARLPASESSDAFRWETAIHSANQGVWDHDFERDRHFLSESWRRMRGLASDAKVAETTEEWLATIHPDDIEHVMAQLDLLDSGGSDEINYKFRQRHADGRWIWILSRGLVVRRDLDGLPARIIGTDTDITDIKSVERERARLSERLDVALDAAKMGRWEFDPRTGSVYWDDRILGIFSLDDGLNIRPPGDWDSHIHPDDREATLGQLKRNIADRQDVSCDFRVFTRDGTEKFLRVRGAYVRDSERGDRYSGVCLDMTEDYRKSVLLQKTRDRLEHESRHDSLTGLANRRHLDRQYRTIIQDPALKVDEQAAMHIDIDHFKKVNDTLGHDAGDAILIHIADVLRRCAGADALIARVGGDEFVVLFPTAPDDHTLNAIAGRIVDEISKPFKYGNTVCDVGASIGIARHRPNPQDPRHLFINADLALYRSKAEGRGRVHFFDQKMKAVAARRQSLQEALKSGIDNGEFVCHYQPQFDAKTLEISGLEALVRWNSPRHGLLLPGDFLPDATEMGLCGTLDDLVLRQTLRNAQVWRAQGLEVPRLAVNVSARRIADPGLLAAISKLDIPSGSLSFELVESAFLDCVDQDVTKNLRALAEMNIDIEIDDFGTGHASIAGLLNIAPRRLKIDRSLVQPIVNSPQRRQLLETLVNIGGMLRIGVVAEGVETRDHIPILQAMGVETLQGFALSRPVPADEVAGLIKKPSVD